MLRLGILLAGAVFGGTAWAELKPFDAKAPQAIAQAHEGKPYVMVMWSLYCEPCRDEMKQWGALRKQHPRVDFILVSTDLPADRPQVERFLARYDLRGVQTWMFSDEFGERVRHAIDPAWRGELPRTYLVDAKQRRRTYTGVMKQAELQAWLGEQQKGAR